MRKYSFILHAHNIPYIVLGENDGPADSPVRTILNLCSNNNHASGSTMKRPLSRISGKENASCGENPPPPKRGHKSNKESGHRCGSCTVWLQTGGNPDLLKHHKMIIGRVHHPGERAADFNSFLCCNGAYPNIKLRSDSCLCDACYRDCTRASGKPRWLKLSEHAVYRHCILCCEGQSEDCSCKKIRDWGPPKWYDKDEELQLILQYF